MSTTPDMTNTDTSTSTNTTEKCVIHNSCNNPDLTCGFMSVIIGSLPVDKNGNPDPNCNSQCGILSKKCISSDKLKEKMAKMKKTPPSSTTNGEPTTTTSSMYEMKPGYNSNEFKPEPPQQYPPPQYPPPQQSSMNPPMGGKKSLKKMKKGGKSNKKNNKTKKSGKKSKSIKKHKKNKK